jgi:hypothetical protein
MRHFLTCGPNSLEDQPAEPAFHPTPPEISWRIDRCFASAAYERIHDLIGELGTGARIGDENPLCLFAGRELLHVPSPYLDTTMCTIGLAAIFSVRPRRDTLPAGANRQSVC